MKFPSWSGSKDASTKPDISPDPTALPSGQSGCDPATEKQNALASTSTSSKSSSIAKHEGKKNVAEVTPIHEAEALEKLSDEPEYPAGAKLAIIVASLCLSVFLMALDNTIIATAIPKITDHFKALDDVGWYGSGKSSRLHMGSRYFD